MKKIILHFIFGYKTAWRWKISQQPESSRGNPLGIYRGWEEEEKMYRHESSPLSFRWRRHSRGLENPQKSSAATSPSSLFSTSLSSPPLPIKRCIYRVLRALWYSAAFYWTIYWCYRYQVGVLIQNRGNISIGLQINFCMQKDISAY